MRERKKRRTYQAIHAAALELFAERGFAATTVAAIAERADVSVRTVSVHFPAKEDLLFPADALFESIGRRLRDREPGEWAIDALRAWIEQVLRESGEHPEEERRRRRDLARSRQRIIDADPGLRQRERGHMAGFERLLAEAVARDTGESPEALLPQMTASAAVAVFSVLARTEAQEGDHQVPDIDQRLAILDRALGFLRGGMLALIPEDAPPPT